MCCNTETHPLAPHPACAAPATLLAGIRLQAGIARDPADPAGRTLRLRFRLTADAAARLRIPPASATPGPRDGLWQHTCLEAFIGDDETRAYREFNFAPSGDWAVYAFADTRLRDPAPDARALAAPRAIWTRHPDGLALDARIALPTNAARTLRIGLSAVLEHENIAPMPTMPTAVATTTTLTYWALAHPRPAPDFHDRAGWTLRLPLDGYPQP